MAFVKLIESQSQIKYNEFEKWTDSRGRETESVGNNVIRKHCMSMKVSRNFRNAPPIETTTTTNDLAHSFKRDKNIP